MLAFGDPIHRTVETESNENMLAACPWVTLVATFVPQTLTQPTWPLTGARQSSSAELSSSQKQLCQQLAQSASGSTLSLNLNGCALHRARTRATTQTALMSLRTLPPLRTLPHTLSSSVLSALCSSRWALRTALSAAGALHGALRTPRSALCALRSALSAHT